MSSGCGSGVGGGCCHGHSDCGAPGTVPLCQRRQRAAVYQSVSPPCSNSRLQEKIKPATSLFSLFKRDLGSNCAISPCGDPNGRPPVKEKKNSFMSIGFGRPGSADGVTRFATTNKLKLSSVGQEGPPPTAAASTISDSVFRVLGRAAVMISEAGPQAVGGCDGFFSVQPSSTEAAKTEIPATPSSAYSSGFFAGVSLSSPATVTQSDQRAISSASKYLLVLGDDPKENSGSGGNINKYNKKRKWQRQRIGDSLQKRQKPIYNYYASGGGWWDGDMEGIDSEEVGFNEVWEGMGSTTIGGLQWH